VHRGVDPAQAHASASVPAIMRASLAASRQGILQALYWLTPPLFCLWMHWLSFRAWFRADDFAWLHLADTVSNFHDFLYAVFAPLAEGTLRPLSERLFFMAGTSLFGLDALPYRMVIFGTQFANLALVAAIGTRLTGSRAAGFWAAIFWTVNSSLMEPLGWACAWNQILCGFFLLLAFWFLLRYIETGARRYNAGQWIAFLLGFGALELNLVYPALAASYTWLCARHRFRGTLAMVPVSIAYFGLHQWVAPPPLTGDYAMHFGTSMLRSLWTYWTWSLGPAYLATPLGASRAELLAGVGLLTAALAVIVFRRLRERQWAALFCLVWYSAVLTPLLPLRDHLMEYYPALPVIGLCWLGAWGFAEAWRAGAAVKTTAVILAALYGVLVIPALRVDAAWNYARTARVRAFLGGLAAAHQLHPRQAFLLYGVDRALFVDAVRELAPRLIGVERVYLAPGSEKQPDLEHEDQIREFVLSGALTARALSLDDLVVYDVRGPHLRNISEVFANMPMERSLPSALDAADPLAASLFGPEWYPPEGNHRWMPKRATLRMAGAGHAGESLYLRGRCADQELLSGPLTVSVTADGVPLPAAIVSSAGFEVTLPLPVSANLEMRLTIEVSRTFHAPGDPRELGLAFGEIAVR
jgi:hypothetical protein